MKMVVNKSSSLRRLDPFLKGDILCVGGRIKHMPSSNEEFKHPTILPKKHHVVDLIIRHYHQQSGHSGVEYVLAEIRQRFWIIKGRVAVRRAIGCCFNCKRRVQPPGQQKMADLPADRITPGQPPFTFVGVDFFGPFQVKKGRSLAKRYGVLYTCLVVRAIHIEVAHSLDTDSFINSLRRFISRRGAPEEIRSDNGTNFKGGNREISEAIRQWNLNQLHEFLLQREIRWHFNPPRASHMGGVWERQIRSVRKVFAAVLKEQTLTDEGLHTLLCEAEAIINGRPLTKLSEDHRDVSVLTPNHLLLFRPNSCFPPGVFSKADSYSKRRWRQVQYLANVFWRRWLKEYIPNLQIRQKWNKECRNFKKGDIVLVMDETMPRGTWPLGRVMEVKTGRDGFVRTVLVKTMKSQLVRPISKICLLEGAPEVEREQC